MFIFQTILVVLFLDLSSLYIGSEHLFFDKDLKYTKCVFTEDLNIELKCLFSSALVGTHFSAGRSIF